MSTQKANRAGAALLLAVFRKALPKSNGFAWVVASAGHINQPNVVRFGFLLAIVGQFDAYLRAQTVSSHCDTLIFRVGARECSAQRLANALRYLRLAHAGGAVMRDGVTGFMTQNRREARVILCDR